jgi:hypothetical protein
MRGPPRHGGSRRGQLLDGHLHGWLEGGDSHVGTSRQRPVFGPGNGERQRQREAPKRDDMRGPPRRRGTSKVRSRRAAFAGGTTRASQRVQHFA